MKYHDNPLTDELRKCMQELLIITTILSHNKKVLKGWKCSVYRFGGEKPLMLQFIPNGPLAPGLNVLSREWVRIDDNRPLNGKLLGLETVDVVVHDKFAALEEPEATYPPRWEGSDQEATELAAIS